MHCFMPFCRNLRMLPVLTHLQCWEWLKVKKNHTVFFFVYLFYRTFCLWLTIDCSISMDCETKQNKKFHAWWVILLIRLIFLLLLLLLTVQSLCTNHVSLSQTITIMINRVICCYEWMINLKMAIFKCFNVFILFYLYFHVIMVNQFPNGKILRKFIFYQKLFMKWFFFKLWQMCRNLNRSFACEMI